VSINLEGHLKPQVGFIPPSGSMATLHPGTRDSRSNTTWAPAAPPVRWRSAALGRRTRTSWQVLPRHQTQAGLSTQRMGVSTSKMATPTFSQSGVCALSEYSKTITPPLIPTPAHCGAAKKCTVRPDRCRPLTRTRLSRYSGPCDTPKFGTLVVVLPTENHSWTFRFRVEL
jgi:hypothetical protein